MDITPVSPADLDQILAIERAGFTPAEAGSRAQYAARIDNLRADFLVARQAGQVAGFVVGPATEEAVIADWMYKAATTSLARGGHQMILTIAVAPNFRGQGVGSRLLAAFEDHARQKGRQSVALTCLADRIPFYEKNGYRNQGQAASTHAGETWYNLIKPL